MFVIANKELFTFDSQAHNCSTMIYTIRKLTQHNSKKEYVIWELKILIVCQQILNQGQMT
jgi:hypothetical protein